MAEFVSELERKVMEFMDGRVGKGFSAKEIIEIVQIHYVNPSSVCQLLDDDGFLDLTDSQRKLVADVMRAELEIPGYQ